MVWAVSSRTSALMGRSQADFLAQLPADAIDKIEEVEAFLRQGTYEGADFEETVQRMVELFADAQD